MKITKKGQDFKSGGGRSLNSAKTAEKSLFHKMISLTLVLVMVLGLLPSGSFFGLQKAEATSSIDYYTPGVDIFDSQYHQNWGTFIVPDDSVLFEWNRWWVGDLTTVPEGYTEEQTISIAWRPDADFYDTTSPTFIMRGTDLYFIFSNELLSVTNVSQREALITWATTQFNLRLTGWDDDGNILQAYETPELTVGSSDYCEFSKRYKITAYANSLQEVGAVLIVEPQSKQTNPDNANYGYFINRGVCFIKNDYYVAPSPTAMPSPTATATAEPETSETPEATPMPLDLHSIGFKDYTPCYKGLTLTADDVSVFDTDGNIADPDYYYLVWEETANWYPSSAVIHYGVGNSYTIAGYGGYLRVRAVPKWGSGAYGEGYLYNTEVVSRSINIYAAPTSTPTSVPSASPTAQPATSAPTSVPSASPTAQPATSAPTSVPTATKIPLASVEYGGTVESGQMLNASKAYVYDVNDDGFSINGTEYTLTFKVGDDIQPNGYALLTSDIGKTLTIIAEGKNNHIGTVEFDAGKIKEGGGSGVFSSPTIVPTATAIPADLLINANYEGKQPFKSGQTMETSKVTVLDENNELVPENAYTVEFLVDGVSKGIGNDYKLKDSDIGKQLEFRVIAKDGSGYRGTVLKPLGNIGGTTASEPPIPTKVPGSGDLALKDVNYGGRIPAKVGDELDGEKATVTDENGNSVPKDGYDIVFIIDGEEKGSNYTLKEEDLGKEIKIKAIGKNGYTGEVEKPLGTVAEKDAPATAVPTTVPSATPVSGKLMLDAHYKDKQPFKPGEVMDVTKVTVLDENNEIVPKNAYTVEFLIDGVSKGIGNNYTLKPSDIGKKLEFRVIAKEGSGYVGEVLKPLGNISDLNGNVATPTKAPNGEKKELDDVNYGGNVPPKVGDTLDGDKATVTDKDGNTVPKDGYDITFIVGGEDKGNNYTLKEEDIGKTIEIKAKGKGEYTGEVKKPIGKAEDKDTYEITFKDGDDETTIEVKKNDKITDGRIPTPSAKEGKEFVGWNTKEDGTGDWITGDTIAKGDMTGYAIYKPALIKDDHFAYMRGYEDGEFRPENNMTRAEVAVMFARLMLKDKALPKAKGIFPDVATNVWCADAIEYLVGLKILTGRDATWFDPNAPVSRAEFAAIASRFENLEKSNGAFSDVPSNFWAYDAINSASKKGWVNGYEDGTFRPMASIRRVEVVTIVNRMLDRHFDTTFDTSKLTRFPDLASNYWGYADIMEATNGHDHKIVNKLEVWTKLK